ncbi:MAG TPA: hypothetical protein VMA36_14745 [Candidatus Limnocylindria bacterium]|jgi:hypothetical protein|nr:hypothetical protein [Candidatus Limnocylindria bacterium]
MRRLLFIPVVLALIIGVAAETATVAGAASPPQALHVALDGKGSRIERLDGYTAKQPIHVRVVAPHSRSVTLVGTDPRGANLRVPLVREGEDRYTGSVVLPTTGIWSLAIASRVDEVDTASQSFAISVVEGTPRKVLAAFIAVALACGVGGLSLIVFSLVTLRRSPRPAV